MEDQRALFKRKEKIERWRGIAKETKKEEAAEASKEDVEMVYVPSNEPLDLGNLHAQKAVESEVKFTKKTKKDRILLKEVGDDLEKLKAIQTGKLSRGQKQRIKRKIEKLENPEASPEQPNQGPEGTDITM